MDRCERLMNGLQASGIDLALIHKPENIRYLTGYTGEGNALIGADKRVILTDFRYIEQAQNQAPGFEVIRVAGAVKLEEALASLIPEGSVLAIEEDCVTVSQYKSLCDALPGRKLTALAGAPEQLRRAKDAGEAEKIREACRISCAAFEKLLPRIHAGMTEKQVQIALEAELFAQGAEAISFGTIVASGANGSLPHAIPSQRVLQEGDLVTLDFGATYDGYHADMTRTIAVGPVSEQLEKMYADVLEAQKRALAKIRCGVPCKEVDAAAREYLDERYPGAFGHGLGHSVGLLIHESPSFNTRDTSVLEEGIVITVEPGVYLPGVGGVRIEDMGVVTKEGFDNFIDAPKELIHI